MTSSVWSLNHYFWLMITDHWIYKLPDPLRVMKVTSNTELSGGLINKVTTIKIPISSARGISDNYNNVNNNNNNRKILLINSSTCTLPLFPHAYHLGYRAGLSYFRMTQLIIIIEAFPRKLFWFLHGYLGLDFSVVKGAQHLHLIALHPL